MSYRIANFLKTCSPNHLLSTSRVRLLQTASFKAPRRSLSSLPNHSKEKAKALAGPVSITSGLLFAATAVGLYWYLQNEKEQLAKTRQARAASENKSIGKPLIGGDFSLIDHFGKPFTQDNLLGKFSIVYFGFTYCPDVCPDELDKMTEIVDNLEKDKQLIQKAGRLQPIFITCDPQRDSPEVIKKYLEDFHSRFIGLTGPTEAVAKACKAYRVYFSRPPKVAPGEDYLVDHSIFFYLMDPAGKFVNCFGKDKTADQATSMIREAMMDYEKDQ